MKQLQARLSVFLVALMITYSLPYAGALGTDPGIPPSEPEGTLTPTLTVELLDLQATTLSGLVGRILLENPSHQAFRVGSIGWSVTITQIGPAFRPIEVWNSTIHVNLGTGLSVQPGRNLEVWGATSLWNLKLVNGTQAPEGTYAYSLTPSWESRPSSTRLFQVGEDQVSILPAEGVIKSILGAEDKGEPREEPGGAQLQAVGTGGSVGYNFRRGTSWETFPVVWNYNDVESTFGFGDVTVLNVVKSAFGTWEGDVGSYIDFNYGATTIHEKARFNDQTLPASNIVDWCRVTSFGDTCRDRGLPPDALAAVQCHSGGSGYFLKCEQLINGSRPYALGAEPNKYDLQSVLTHEAGHWVGLGDIYNPGLTGYASWMGTNNQNQVMYGEGAFNSDAGRTLKWGDYSGARYIYPETGTGPTSIGDATVGVDLATGHIGGGTAPDMLVAWIDDPAGENTIFYRVGFDLSSATGKVTGGWSGIHSVSAASWTNQGLGVALRDLDGNGRPELFLAWIDAPDGENRVLWRVAQDLTTAGAPAQWSTIRSMTGVGWDNEGVGACIVDLDSDGIQDVVLGWVDNPLGSNTIFYKVGQDLSKDGSIGAWQLTRTGASAIGDYTEDMAIACANFDERNPRTSAGGDFLLSWVDSPAGANTPMYKIIRNPDAAGAYSASDPTSVKRMPVGSGIGWDTAGIGASAIELDNEGVPEVVFAWADDPVGSNTIRHRTDWNLRFDAQP